MTPRAARVETPADTLRRAAEAVRNAAHKTAPLPWTAKWDRLNPAWVAHAATWGTGFGVVGSSMQPPDAAWITLLNPAIAEPLAAWLDYVVERMSVYDEEFEDDGGSVTHALAFARALLGSPVPEPDGEGT